MRADRWLLCAALALGLTGCPIFGSCPEGETNLLVSGTFQSQTSAGQLYPAPEIERKTVVLDRQAGTVKITYTRKGKLVEERWKIKDITEQRY